MGGIKTYYKSRKKELIILPTLNYNIQEEIEKQVKKAIKKYFCVRENIGNLRVFYR